MLELEQIRIDGGTQSRVELNQETVAEYAQAFTDGAEFPPVVVFFDGAFYWLADGFHRYFGARDAGESAIDAEIRTGTQRDAVLYSWGANDKHGLPRSNADKRRIVTAILRDEQGRQWSDRDIAKRFGFSNTFVGNIRRSLSTVDSEKPAERTYTTKHGATAVMNTANIGKKQTAGSDSTPTASAPKEEQAAAIAKPIHKKEAPEPQQQEEDEYTELDALADQVRDLQAEVARLKLLVPAEADEGNDMLKEMQHEMATLRQANKAITIARDRFQAENAELKRQCVWLKKQLDKQK